MIGKFQTFQNHLPSQLTQNQDSITQQELKVSKMGRKFMKETKGLKNVGMNLRRSPRF
jgi:hypothetical protein